MENEKRLTYCNTDESHRVLQPLLEKGSKFTVVNLHTTYRSHIRTCPSQSKSNSHFDSSRIMVHNVSFRRSEYSQSALGGRRSIECTNRGAL